MFFSRLITASTIILLATSVLAAPSDRVPGSSVSAISMSIDNTTLIDANRILMFVTNHGNYGRDLNWVFGYDYGTWWPYAGDTAAIRENFGHAGEYSPQYAGGIWLGGIVNAEIRVAVSEFNNFEFGPGPMEDGTYQPDEPAFRVYNLYRDSLADNPNVDYTEWPEDQGAPVDGSGAPVMLGDRMLWSVYNDANSSLHTNECGSTEPLGIEVQQTVYAYDQLGALGDIVFIQYKLYNRGFDMIDDFYISMWNDPDLGEASDDYIGCDTMDNIYFVYNADDDDSKYGTAPPAGGFRVLAGPIVSSPGDSAYFDRQWIQDYKNIGMSSFNKYINGTDPYNAAETYGFMQGLTKAGTPYVYEGEILTYVHSGDPVTSTGDLDEAPADRRMMASFGPFDFNPGDSQFVLIAYAVGRGGNNLESVTVLKGVLNSVDDLPTAVAEVDHPALPQGFAVGQNYPNPFNPSTTIMYSLPERARVTIDVFNVLGQRVRRLVDKTQPAGDHSVIWNGDDETGEPVSTGLYFYRVTAGDKIDHKKMLLLK